MRNTELESWQLCGFESEEDQIESMEDQWLQLIQEQESLIDTNPESNENVKKLADSLEAMGFNVEDNSDSFITF